MSADTLILAFDDMFPPAFWRDLVAEALTEAGATPTQIETVSAFMSDPDLRALLPDLMDMLASVASVVGQVQSTVAAVAQKS